MLKVNHRKKEENMKSNTDKVEHTIIEINDNDEYQDNEENEDIQDNNVNQTNYIIIALMVIVVTIFSLSFASYYLSFSSNNKDQNVITNTHQRSQLVTSSRQKTKTYLSLHSKRKTKTPKTIRETPEQRLQRAKDELKRISKQLHQPLKYDDRVDGHYRIIGFFDEKDMDTPVFSNKYKFHAGYYTLAMAPSEGNYSHRKVHSDPYTYEGMVKSGNPHGYGVQTFSGNPHGKKYSGGFYKGLPNGYGELVSANGYTYKGWWKNQQRAGMGIAKHTNGVIQFGEFKDDVISTGFKIKGDLVLAEYEDKLKVYDFEQRAKDELQRISEQLHQPLKYDDRFDGDYRIIGFFDEKDMDTPVFGNKYKLNAGYYTLARAPSTGKYFHIRDDTDADTYEGMVKSGKRHGYGVVTFSNGDKYSGGFYEGNKNGYGELVEVNGYTYKGWWENEQRAGMGIAKDIDGSIEFGEFRDNVISTGFKIKDDRVLAEYEDKLELYVVNQK